MSVLHNELLAIRERHGRLTPELVLDEARDPNHRLHSHFTWDDGEAAERWRLTQAAGLLRAVKVAVDPSRPADLRAFVAVRGADSHRSDYVPVEEAMADDFTRRLVLRTMEREWKTLRRRYKDMSEFAELVLRDLRDEVS